MAEQQLPIFKIAFDSTLDKGVTAISLVDYPAIESDFIAFAKTDAPQMWRFASDEKREIVGAVLIPDKLIYRRNGDFEYFVTFPKDVIEDLAFTNMLRGCECNFTLMHNHTDDNPYHDLVNGIETLNNWIETEDYRQCVEYGFSEKYIPLGSWMMRLHITNDDVWREIKENNLRGFSVELYAGIEPLIFKQQPNK